MQKTKKYICVLCPKPEAEAQSCATLYVVVQFYAIFLLFLTP